MIFSVLSACGELVAIITPDLRIITQTLSFRPPYLVSEKGEEGGAETQGIPLIHLVLKIGGMRHFVREVLTDQIITTSRLRPPSPF